MTMLEKILSKDALASIDVFRQERGIRSRRQALELLLHEQVERMSAGMLEQIKTSRQAEENGTEEFVGFDALKARALRRNSEPTT